MQTRYLSDIVEVQQSDIGQTTTVLVKPVGFKSGWSYVHVRPVQDWLTYHVHDVQSITIDEQKALMSDDTGINLNVTTANGEIVTIFLLGASLDMIADAIGCEQMVIQATQQEDSLA